MSQQTTCRKELPQPEKKPSTRSLTGNIIFSGERTNAFPLNLGKSKDFDKSKITMVIIQTTLPWRKHSKVPFRFKIE